MRSGKKKLPAAVLAKAKRLAATTAQKPQPPPRPTTVPERNLPREKIVAALKKLHPMD